jgi:hypothetical protein
MNPANIDVIGLPRRASQMDNDSVAAMHTTKNPPTKIMPVAEPSPWTFRIDAKNATAELVPNESSHPTANTTLSTDETGTKKKLPALDSL